MILTLKINGVNKTSSVVWDSLEKSDVINEKVDTLKFAIRKYGSSTFEPLVNDTVELFDGAELIYKGVILTINKTTEGHSIVRYDVDCADNTHFLNRYLVLESYKDTTIDYIIDDIITKYGPNSVNSGLIAHYKFNADATDSSGGGNNGTANGVIYEAGKIREAAKFDGNDYVSIPSVAVFNNLGKPLSAGGSNYSISVWFKSSTLADQSITEKWPGGSYPFVIRGPLSSLNGGVRFATHNAASSGDSVTAIDRSYADGQWHHVVAIRDLSIAMLYLYIDGVLKDSHIDNNTNADLSNTGVWAIGARTPSTSSFNFTGDIDDFRLYNRALSPAEVTKLYDIGITTNNVTAPISVKSISFNRISVSDALQKLANVSNYSWYLDYDNDLHFFERNTEPAPFSLTDTSDNYIYDSLQITDDISQLRNRVFIRGGETEGDERTELLDGNGTKKFFPLSNKFSKLPTVKVGGVTKTVGVDYLDSEDDFDAFWNFNEKYIRFKTAPATGTGNVETIGTPLYPISAQVQDGDSIEQYGLSEFAKTDRTIKTKQEAKDFAVAELEAYAEKVSEGSFETYTPGLRSGQLITVNSTSRGINEDFLIQKLTFRMVNNDVGIYKVDLATLRTIGIIDFLIDQLRLGSRIIEEKEEEVLEKYLSASEIVTIGESFSSSTSHNPQSETVTVAETFTPQSLNYAVEFVVGPTVPTGTKRQFVLNGSRLG